MTPSRIAELRVLAAAATPGPYRVVGDDVYCPDDETAPRGYSPVVYLAECMHDRNASYIAAACNAVPRLCDEIERLRAEFRAHGAVCVEGAEANAETIAELRADVERLCGIVDAAKVVAYRGEHTGDCIGASGGACFEDDRDECECGLTTLRNALKGSE